MLTTKNIFLLLTLFCSSLASAQNTLQPGNASNYDTDWFSDLVKKFNRKMKGEQTTFHLNDKKAPDGPAPLALDSCRTLQTSWTGGNSNDGIMVNISTFDWVMIENFSVFIHAYDSGYVKIYYTPDTAKGHEMNPADWTFIDSAFVVGSGSSTPTFIPINVNVTIPAWSMYSFYITGTGTPNIIYSSDTVTAYDSTITIWPGAGLAYPFAMPTGMVYQDRVFNGIVHYCEAPVGIEEASQPNEISIAPNPFNEYTELVFGSPVADAEVIVYNMLGGEVKRLSADNVSRVRLDREGLVAGMYVIRVADGSSIIAVKKIVIE